MSAETNRLGFMGLGIMGYPMASCLHEAGYPVTVLDDAKTQAVQFQAVRRG